MAKFFKMFAWELAIFKLQCGMLDFDFWLQYSLWIVGIQRQEKQVSSFLGNPVIERVCHELHLCVLCGMIWSLKMESWNRMIIIDPWFSH